MRLAVTVDRGEGDMIVAVFKRMVERDLAPMHADAPGESPEKSSKRVDTILQHMRIIFSILKQETHGQRTVGVTRLERLRNFRE